MLICSNHCEGLYGNVHNFLPKLYNWLYNEGLYGIFSTKTGSSKIVDYVINYLNRRTDIYGESLKKKHISKIEKVRTILKSRPNRYLKCAHH